MLQTGYACCFMGSELPRNFRIPEKELIKCRYPPLFLDNRSNKNLLEWIQRFRREGERLTKVLVDFNEYDKSLGKRLHSTDPVANPDMYTEIETELLILRQRRDVAYKSVTRVDGWVNMFNDKLIWRANPDNGYSSEVDQDNEGNTTPDLSMYR